MKNYLFTFAILSFCIFGAHAQPAASSPDPATQQGEAFKMRLQEAQRKFNPQPSENVLRTNQRQSTGIQQSVVNISSKNSRGTGFICKLWGIPVLITNAHVFADMIHCSIEDMFKNTYQYRGALISKERDLAILEIDLPPGVKPLALNYNVGKLPLNTQLNAYGDSKGAGVIVELSGQLIGIGPNDIEISAPIVPGNSGGPVVTADGKVIGMSTYLLLPPNALATDGTRFGNAQKQNTGIRRFAIRVDNLQIPEFEIFSSALQQADLKNYQKLSELNEEFFKNIDDLQYHRIRRIFYHDYTRAQIPWNYKTSISYLAPLINKRLQECAILAMVLEMPLTALSPREINYVTALRKHLRNYRKPNFSCEACMGSGTITNHQMSDGRSNLSGSGAIENCPRCQGIGKVPMPYYKLPSDPLSNRVAILNRIVPGVPLGMNPISLKRSFKGIKMSAINVNGIFEQWIFTENPTWERAQETEFFFCAKRLASVKMVFAPGKSSWTALEEKLHQSFGKPVYVAGKEAVWQYQLYQRPGCNAALTYIDIGKKNQITLIINHSALNELTFQLLDDLDENFFITPMFFPTLKDKENSSRSQEGVLTRLGQGFDLKQSSSFSSSSQTMASQYHPYFGPLLAPR